MSSEIPTSEEYFNFMSTAPNEKRADYFMDVVSGKAKFSGTLQGVSTGLPVCRVLVKSAVNGVKMLLRVGDAFPTLAEFNEMGIERHDHERNIEVYSIIRSGPPLNFKFQVPITDTVHYLKDLPWVFHTLNGKIVRLGIRLAQ